MSALVNSSIVFVIRDNNPEMYTPDFFRDFQIFPEDYKIQPIVNIPPLSQIRFGRQYRLEAVENRLMLECNYSPPFEAEQQELPDMLVSVGKKLLEILRTQSFSAIGINFRFHSTGNDMTILNVELPESARLKKLAYQVDDDPFRVTVELEDAFEKDSQQAFVRSNLNFHGDVSTERPRPKRAELAAQYLSLREQCFAKGRELLRASGL